MVEVVVALSLTGQGGLVCNSHHQVLWMGGASHKND